MKVANTHWVKEKQYDVELQHPSYISAESFRLNKQGVFSFLLYQTTPKLLLSDEILYNYLA